MMTMAMPVLISLAMSVPNSIVTIASTVVSVVIKIGRIRVRPVATRASVRSSPPMRSWLA